MKILRRIKPPKPLHKNVYFVTALAVILLFTTLFPPRTVQAASSPPDPLVNAVTPKPQRQEVTSLRTLDRKVYQNPNGSYTTEVSQFPIHYKDADGQFKDIDTSVADSNGELKADKTYTKPVLEKTSGNDGKVGGLTIEGRTVILKVKGMGQKTGTPDKTGITYSGIAQDTDLHYQVTPSGLKEEVRLSSVKGASKLSFELDVSNAKAANDHGDLVFSDAITGKFLFKMPKPYMYDNSTASTDKQALSEDVSYGVSQTGDSFDITLNANQQWLNDPVRKFPVTIDPTITLNAPYYDGFVESCNPTTTHYSEAYMVADTGTCTRRSYACFSNLPTLPTGATITSANLQLYQYEVSDANEPVGIYRATTSWNGTTLTWNNQPSLVSPATYTFTDGTNNGQINPDVKNIVTSWYSGQPNDGVMLTANPETGTYHRTWRTANWTDPSTYPKLVINYTAPYSAQYVGATAPPSSTAPGEQFTETFSYKNTGTNTWYPDGANPIHLGTQDPQDRNSPFYTNDGHWQTQNRVKLDQQLVRPGDTGTFTMTMTAPATTGNYTEDWGVVADGYSWLEQPGGVTVNVVAKSYSSAWQAQGGNMTLQPGQSSLVWMDIKNTGNVTWRRDGANPIRIGTSNPLDRGSGFAITPVDWVATNRATGADKSTVAPGDTARFSFVIKAPENMAPGSYPEYFRPLIEGVTWLTDNGIYLPITVSAGSVATEWGRADNGNNTSIYQIDGGISYANQRVKKVLNLPTVPSGPVGLNMRITWQDAQFSDNVFNGGVHVYAKVNNGAPVDITSQFSSLPEFANRMTTVQLSARDFVPGNNDVVVYATDPPSGYREHIGFALDNGGSQGKSFVSSNGGSSWTGQSNEFIMYLQGVDNIGDMDYATKVGGVNVANGNLNLGATDINLAAKGMPIKLNRTYNSQSRETGVLGAGWQFDFEQRLMFSGSNVRWISEDGQQFVYTDAGSGNYNRPANTQVTLTKNTDLFGTVTYDLKDKKNLKTTFDSNGRLKSTTDQNGNQISYTYTNNLLTKITDPSGRDTTLAYDANNKLSSITDFAGHAVSYGYANGLLVTMTDARNNTSAYTYDANQRLTNAADMRGNQMQYAYDSLGRVSTITDAKELDNPTPKRTQFSYDSPIQTSVTDTKDSVSRYVFDSFGRVTSIINASVTPNTVRYQTWDKDFNRVSETDPTGAQKQHEFDAYGNLTRDTDELGNVTTNTYDTCSDSSCFNNLQTTTNPKGVQQKFEYDSSGNKTKEYADFTNTPTKFTQYSYDGSGNQTQIIDPNNHETDYEYDSYGRVTKEKAPPQSDPKVTEYTYDSAGNKLTVKDPLNNITAFEYNANNQVTKQTDPAGNVSQYAYDGNGNKTSETDPKSQVTTYTYDKLNQLTNTTSPDPNKKTDYQYDKTGNVTSVADGKGQASTVTYDGEGKPVSETTSNITTNLTYSAAGDVTQATAGSGSTQSTISSAVDKAGQETAQTAQVGTGTASTTNYSYDANGNQITAVNVSTGQTAAQYDSKDQVKTETDTAYNNTSVQYDANGNVTSLTLPSGKTITYSYDDNDRLTGSSVTVSATNANQNIVSPVVKTGDSTTTEATSLDYDKAGNITKITKGNGTYSQYTYDTANKITGVATKTTDGSIISSYSYTYDQNGNITIASGDSVSTSYTYDNVDQLLTASDDQSRSWGYTYDASGNRTQITGPTGTTTYIYGNAADKNQLTSSAKDGVTTTYTYDSRGNNIGRSDGTTIIYDANNLITSAKIGSGPTVTYTYDTDKHMIARTVNGVTTRYQYDGDNLSAETDNTGTITVAYSYDDNGKRISETRKDVDDPNGSNKVYYYHYDGHGSVTTLTDPSGNVVKRYSYDPFGNVLSATGDANLTNSFTYSGYFQDPDTGLYLLKARAYDAQLGRFLSVDPNPSNDDPKQDPVLNANLYLYTNNNPVTNIDIDGTGKCGIFHPKDCIKNAWNSIGNTVNNALAKPLSTTAGYVATVVGVTAAAVTAPWWAPRAIGFGGARLGGWVGTRVAARFWTYGRFGSRVKNLTYHFTQHGGYKSAFRYTFGAYRTIWGANKKYVYQNGRVAYMSGKNFVVRQGSRIVTHYKIKNPQRYWSNIRRRY